MITGCCIRVHVRSQPFPRIRCSASLRGTVPMGSGGGTRRGARVPKTHLLYSRLRPALLPRVVGLSSGSCLSWCASAFLEVGQALAQPARSRRHASRPSPTRGFVFGWLPHPVRVSLFGGGASFSAALPQPSPRVPAVARPWVCLRVVASPRRPPMLMSDASVIITSLVLKSRP